MCASKVGGGAKGKGKDKRGGGDKKERIKGRRHKTKKLGGSFFYNLAIFP